MQRYPFSSKKSFKKSLTRRAVLQSGTVLALGVLAPRTLITAEAVSNESLPHQATGLKIGEVTDASALVWVRLTQNPVRLPDDNAA
jgi:phosphodiesterase/alkaline phosphatase D-like protein